MGHKKKGFTGQNGGGVNFAHIIHSGGVMKKMLVALSLICGVTIAAQTPTTPPPGPKQRTIGDCLLCGDTGIDETSISDSDRCGSSCSHDQCTRQSCSYANPSHKKSLLRADFQYRDGDNLVYECTYSGNDSGSSNPHYQGWCVRELRHSHRNSFYYPIVP